MGKESGSFVMYSDYMQHLELLSMEQRGVFITAVMAYASGAELPEMDGMVKMAFSFTKAQIDRDSEQYRKTLEARREAGKQGGRPKANGFSEKQKKAKKANGFSEKQKNPDTVNDTDTDTVTVNDTVTGTDNKKNILADARDLFERLWRLYPCKKGKGQVSDTQKKRLLAIGEPALVKAIERYSTELQKDAGWRKPQYGSTFFNSGYVDYLDGNFVPSEQKPTQKAQPPNRFNNFPQREYNWDELEKKLLESQKGGVM